MADSAIANIEQSFGNASANKHGVWSFEAGDEPTNSIMVTGRRDEGSLSGRVGLFFGHILGVSTFEPVHVATMSINNCQAREAHGKHSVVRALRLSR